MQISSFLADKKFLKKVFYIALPIALQNLITSTINMADVFMIGQLGESEIAGVGLANQIFFLFILLLFGTNSGAGVFIAQYWGKKDTKSIYKVLGLALIISICVSLIFGGVSSLIPKKLLGIYSSDLAVLDYGSRYLALVSLSYPFSAISFVYSFSLRSIARASLAMYVSLVTLFLNIGLDYLLIFGKYGFPELGVEGAAIATVIARIMEAVVMVLSIYILKNYRVLAASFQDLLSFNMHFVAKFLGISLPVIFNEGVWALGMTTYNIIYARMSTEALASVNIANSIDQISFVSFIGLAAATSVMIGNKIGEQKEELAYTYAVKLSFISLISALAINVFLFLMAKPILGLYNISPDVFSFSYYLIFVQIILLPFRAFNITNIVGSLRAGGDTRYTLILDLAGLWLFGIPLALAGAFWFKWPVYIVAFLAGSEEVIKFTLTLRRLRSKKWIKNLVS